MWDDPVLKTYLCGFTFLFNNVLFMHAIVTVYLFISSALRGFCKMSLKLKSVGTSIQVFSLQREFLARSEPQLETAKRFLSFLVRLTFSPLFVKFNS